jgi:hypothetical protein
MIVNIGFGNFGWPMNEASRNKQLDVGKTIPPIYHGLMGPKGGIQALKAAFW